MSYSKGLYLDSLEEEEILCVLDEVLGIFHTKLRAIEQEGNMFLFSA